MKREQLEKIVRAAASLYEAVEGARTIHVSRAVDGVYLLIKAETDEDVQALAGVFAVAPSQHHFDNEYYLGARITVGNIPVHINGPYHRVERPRELDEAKLDAALAQAADAIGGTP